MKPVIALVGRPNVGKSTLFNRLTKSRDAIVADYAGLTRDRHYGDGRLGDREYIVIDTGGFEPDSSTGIVKEMAKQTQQAVAEADAVVFVVDVRAGLSAQDYDIARYLRSVNKRVILAANKAEGMKDAPQIAEFYELGMGEPMAVSAALLVAAAAGYAVPDVVRLVTAAVSPGSRDTQRDATPGPGVAAYGLSDPAAPLDRVLAIGHTSGRDLVSGVAGVLRALHECLDPRDAVKLLETVKTKGEAGLSGCVHAVEKA